MERARLLWLVPVACFLVANPAFAQSGGDTFGGVQGGATYNLSGRFNSRWGGTAGLFASVRTTWYSVGTVELNWVQKGAEDIRLDYVEVPVLAGAVMPAMNGSLRFRGYIGIALGVKIGCSIDDSFLDCGRVNSTEWSLPFGFMLGRWLESGKFFALDVRYSPGLSDVFETTDFKNSSWQFRALVGMPLRAGR